MRKLLFMSLLLSAGMAVQADTSETLKLHSYQIAVLQNDVAALKNQPDTNTSHHPGELYRGGIVFWVDDIGQHGLIASVNDLNNQQGIQWRNGNAGNKITNARGDGLYAGETNTRLIIAQQTIDNQNGQFAALIAANYQVLADGITPCKTPVNEGQICYGGWYLPSAFELQLLHKNLQGNNQTFFAPEFYWSSTEASVSNAWLQNFGSGEILSSSKSSTLGRVRAISRF